MNEHYECNITQKHVIPIMVTLTEEEWLEAQSFWSSEFLYFLCERDMMEDESELDRDTNFGDFIRWLFKLAPSDKDIPIEVVFRRKLPYEGEL